jgi:hypothetical protein
LHSNNVSTNAPQYYVTPLLLKYDHVINAIPGIHYFVSC